jgi:hypothetical protein
VPPKRENIEDFLSFFSVINSFYIPFRGSFGSKGIIAVKLSASVAFVICLVVKSDLTEN